jgi:hypothetical protein
MNSLSWSCEKYNILLLPESLKSGVTVTFENGTLIIPVTAFIWKDEPNVLSDSYDSQRSVLDVNMKEKVAKLQGYLTRLSFDEIENKIWKIIRSDENDTLDAVEKKGYFGLFYLTNKKQIDIIRNIVFNWIDHADVIRDTKKEADEIINNRHTVNKDDFVVKFLNHLENRYGQSNNREELEKVYNLRIISENGVRCINFIKEWLTLKLENENITVRDFKDLLKINPITKKMNWIFYDWIFKDDNWNDYFTIHAVEKYWLGKCPTSFQWDKILEAIPWNTDDTIKENAEKILNIPKIGKYIFVSINSYFQTNKNEWIIWSKDIVSSRFFYDYKFISFSEMEKWYNWSSTLIPLRLLV